MAGEAGSTQKQVAWDETISELPIEFANVFTTQTLPDGMIFILGHINQPLFKGSPDQIRKQIDGMTEVPVKPIARYFIPKGVLGAVMELIQQGINQGGA